MSYWTASKECLVSANLRSSAFGYECFYHVIAFLLFIIVIVTERLLSLFLWVKRTLDTINSQGSRESMNIIWIFGFHGDYVHHTIDVPVNKSMNQKSGAQLKCGVCELVILQFFKHYELESSVDFHFTVRCIESWFLSLRILNLFTCRLQTLCTHQQGSDCSICEWPTLTRWAFFSIPVILICQTLHYSRESFKV